MGSKYSFIVIYLLITASLFITFDAKLGVWLSFLASATIITLATLYHIFIEKEYSPFLSAFIVFTFLFFLVAPIIQINSFESANPLFITLFPYNEGLVIYTNILISLFNLVFFGSYLLLKKYTPLRRIPKISENSLRVLPVTILCISVLCVVFLIASYGFIQDEISRPNWLPSDYSIMALLGWKKVFFLVPLGGIILCFQYFKKENKKAINFITIAAVMLFLLVLLIWFKNPLTEKRNALGPIYICLLFLFLPRLFNTNIKTLFFLFFSMIILFPLSAILTHTDASFKEIAKDPNILLEHMKGGGVSGAFNTLNYDAFFNITTTIDYVTVNGYSMGYQLLSGLLFFVPRSIWESKPNSTGQLVGDYLIDDYGYKFNNLSNPLVSEGYINFGIVGVVLMAFALALVIVKLLSWIKSDDYLKKIMALYFAMHLIFLLRGDFTNGFSYYIGTLIGVLVIPKTAQFLIKQISISQNRWKLSKK